jgi:hypothetical protein
MRTSDLHVLLLRHTNRLSGCHTVPKGITSFLPILPNFKAGKNICCSF